MCYLMFTCGSTQLSDRSCILQAGLYDKWVAQLLFKVEMESRKKKQDEQLYKAKMSNRPQGLSMRHVQGAFIVLLLGFGISCLALAVEILSIFVHS